MADYSKRKSGNSAISNQNRTSQMPTPNSHIPSNSTTQNLTRFNNSRAKNQQFSGVNYLFGSKPPQQHSHRYDKSKSLTPKPRVQGSNAFASNLHMANSKQQSNAHFHAMLESKHQSGYQQGNVLDNLMTLQTQERQKSGMTQKSQQGNGHLSSNSKQQEAMFNLMNSNISKPVGGNDQSQPQMSGLNWNVDPFQNNGNQLLPSTKMHCFC